MRFSVPRNGAPGVQGASWIRAEGDDLPHPVLVRLGLGDDERLVATGVLIEADGELTARTMRIPLARIVAEFAAAASKPTTYKRLRRELFGIASESAGEAAWRPQTAKGVPASWLAFDFLALSERERPVQRARLRPGPKGWPDDHYREVARVYRRAKLQHPRAPVKALMEAMHTTEPTAHRWIKTAREKGYIQPKED